MIVGTSEKRGSGRGGRRETFCLRMVFADLVGADDAKEEEGRASLTEEDATDAVCLDVCLCVWAISFNLQYYAVRQTRISSCFVAHLRTCQVSVVPRWLVLTGLLSRNRRLLSLTS